MDHRNGIEHILRCILCWTLSLPWAFFPVSGNFLVRSSLILYLHNTQTTDPRVVGGHHIPSSGVARDFVVVGFPDRNCYSMVSEVLFVISLSHLNCTETYST